MSTLEATLRSIEPTSAAIGGETRALLDGKTKPRGSLGRLEELACRLAAIAGHREPPVPKKAVVVMAADHGVAAEGVSAYPQDVTGQMVLNFVRGGAAINVLAEHAGARVLVVDMGVREPLPALPALRSHRVGPGTANMVGGPAMERRQAVEAIETGIALANELADASVGMIGIGEMGIGNTTAASAMTALLTGQSVADVTGCGTGIPADRLPLKVGVIQRALSVNSPDATDALDVLATVGGFEIAGMCGVVLGAAARRVAVVLDGFITGAAALAAVRLAPRAGDYLIASHASVEPGHLAVLRALDQKPLLDLSLRLGEGTGSALAMGLSDAALKILHGMATFEGAGVTDSGR